jgi:6-phosphogluconate dehydrogenase (decarboxylating)
MQMGMVGLGRMGANMVRRLLRGGHNCVVFDMSRKAVDELVQEKATAAASLADLLTTSTISGVLRSLRRRESTMWMSAPAEACGVWREVTA